MARRVTHFRSVRWIIESVRGSRAVWPASQFLIGQLLPSRGRTYRLRGSGHVVTLRHRSRDVDILNEIFGGTGGINCYEPPPEVAQRLDQFSSPTILDLGANIGLFGVYAAARWPTARMIAFEPDPANAGLLEATIAANRLGDRWKLNRAACSNAPGTIRFVAGLLCDSRVATDDDPQAITVPTVDIFRDEFDADFIKMDIEGAEWPILADRRLATLRASAIVLEWHRRGCPEGDARAAAERLWRQAGYEHILHVCGGASNGLMWAWR